MANTTYPLTQSGATVQNDLNIIESLSPNAFNTNTSYHIGDVVVYEGNVYECSAPGSGAWDSSRWAAKNIKGLLDDTGVLNGIAYEKSGTISTLVNTSWRLNDYIFSDTDETYYIKFISNSSETFDRFDLAIGLEIRNSLTYKPTTMSPYITVYSHNRWLSNAYKTIEITGGPSVTNTSLINWLEQNATQIETSKNVILHPNNKGQIDYTVEILPKAMSDSTKQNVLTTTSVQDGSISKNIGFDSSGNLVKATPSTGGMSNPMTALGDVIYGGTVTSGTATPARLGMNSGDAGKLLAVNSGGTAPTWTNALPVITTAPVEANTNGIIICVLSTNPSNKYNGYLYLITG